MRITERRSGCIIFEESRNSAKSTLPLKEVIASKNQAIIDATMMYLDGNAKESL